MVQQQSQTNSNDLYSHNGHTSALKDLQADRTLGFSHNSYKQRNGSINTNNGIHGPNIQYRLRFSQSREQDSYAIADNADNISQTKEEVHQHKSAMASEFNSKTSTTQQINHGQYHNQNKIPKTLPLHIERSLTEAINSLYEELLPTEESHERRKRFVDKIERILNEEWPDHEIKVNLFGSSMNLLGTSTSDVDICVTTPWNGLKNITILAKGMKKHGMQGIYCVPKAKVPIVRLWDPTLTYVSIDSRVRPLAMIIKHWARQRVLNDAGMLMIDEIFGTIIYVISQFITVTPKGGTLSTYTWTCMILNFLQMRDPPILPVLHRIPHEPNIVNGVDVSFYEDIDKLEGFGSKNNESVGGLLFAFFRCFAYEFDYEHNVISLREGRYLTKEEKGWGDTGKGWRLLCVEEPFNTSRNLGNSADNVSVNGLREEFRRAVKILYEKESKESLRYCCQQYVFPTYNNRAVGYHYNKQSGKRSAHYRHRVNGYHKQRDGGIVNDNNGNFRKREESDKNDDNSSYVPSHQRVEHINQNNQSNQRSFSPKHYSNSKNNNVFGPIPNYDVHFNQNFITDSKQDSVSEFNWERPPIYTPESVQIPNYSENRGHSSELNESSINTQKNNDESNKMLTYPSVHNKSTIPLNQKLICAASQKHIGQPNQKYFNVQNKSITGTNRISDHESEKKSTNFPDHKPVREMKSNFNHLSNINSVHDSDQPSSPKLGCQTTQASNFRSGQTFNKSANLHSKSSCNSSRPNEEANYKTYAYGGCGENSTLIKTFPNLTTPKINGGHGQLTMTQTFDKKTSYPVTAAFIPQNHMSIYSSQHIQSHNSQPYESSTTFQRRLSHQSSSDGSNSLTSGNSSNTSYSSNSFQQNVSSNKPRDNYYSNNNQNNNSNKKKRQHHNANNYSNFDNNNGQHYQGRNLSNESNSVITSMNSIRSNNNSTISSQSAPNIRNENVMSNYSTSQKLNQHNSIPKGSNGNMNYNTNGFKNYNGVNNNNSNGSNYNSVASRNNVNAIKATNGGNQNGYFNGLKETKYDTNNENFSNGQKTNNNNYHHSNLLKTSNNGHSNNNNYSNVTKSINGYQNNHYVNGSKTMNGGNQIEGNYAHALKGSNGGYSNNDNCHIRSIPVNGSHFKNNCHSNYSDVLKTTSNGGANNNYANVAKSMNENNQNSVKYSNCTNDGSQSINYNNDAMCNMNGTSHYTRDSNNYNAHKTFDGNNFNASKTVNSSSGMPKTTNINTNNCNNQRNNSNYRNKNQNRHNGWKHKKNNGPQKTDKKDDNTIQQHQGSCPISISQQQQETGSKQKNNAARLKGGKNGSRKSNSNYQNNNKPNFVNGDNFVVNTSR
ncbi:23330_t:CDS:2 [Gigaspora margarita]|uniref:polynucleotide adenylyltransferase n=1 Tax=Gigaspora margarita TaxID=4874 RepID=A0ABM8W674_GIGMA|nr:23330_t:CDS:2 [Gigaspora margarita]